MQEQALTHLASGKSIAAAARSAGVNRRTVFRWLESDPHFAAAYNAWRKETVASGRARVLAMTDIALDTVQSAILDGNARVAVQVAKATGVMDAPKPGTTDPSRFYRRKRLRDAKWQEALAKAESAEALDKRAREYHRSPAHCEYMIDSYIKCRREALRAESPDDRARRLAEQPKYHRNYDPITLRLFATLDAEDAVSNAPARDDGNAAANAPDDRALQSNAIDPDASVTAPSPRGVT
jgi:hypothetical protein